MPIKKEGLVMAIHSNSLWYVPVSSTWLFTARDELLIHIAQEINRAPQRNMIDQHAVTSYAQVSWRIQEFVNKVLLNQKGEFMCMFPFSPGCGIRVMLGCGRVSPEGESNLKEICIFRRAVHNNTAALANLTELNYRTFRGQGSPTSRFTSYAALLPSNVSQSDVEYERILNILRTRVDNLVDLHPR